MTTLAIDTSTNRGSVALLQDGALLLEENFSAERSHTATLFSVLERARARTGNFDLVAVGLGPGSYAGMRIAIAAAIGLELGMRARVAGLPSVAALETDEPRYLAIGDARRETFYFTRVEDGACLEGPLLLSEAELRARLAQFPDWPIFSTAALPGFPAAQISLPVAAKLAALAETGKSIVAEENLEPIYLREPHITRPKLRPPLGPQSGR